MDLKLTNYDMDITDGLLSFVTGAEAVRQHVEMRLRTWLGESVYDRSAGVPYTQVIFQKGVTAASIRFILTNIVEATPGIDEVLSLEVDIDPRTREASGSGRARAGDEEIDFSIGA